MSKRFPANAVRYAVVLIIAGIWGREFFIPGYGTPIVDRVPELTSFQSDVIKAVSFLLPLLLAYFGGVLADKYGRRLTWAALLLMYGGGMLWLNTLSSYAFFASFGPALIVAVLIGISYTFARSPLAWLFDHEEKEGTKNAYGLLYILLALLFLVGLTVRTIGFSDPRLTTVSCVLIMVMGIVVMTFPENYGNRSASWVHIAKTGVTQFISSRVLQLIVVQSIFMEFSSLARIYSFLTFTNEFKVPAADLNTILLIEYIAAALLAGILLLLMKKIDYKKLIIYPMIFMTVLYVLLSFAPTVSLFFILRGAAIACSILAVVGVIILINDSISENRATVLSLLAVLMSIFGFFSSYWGAPLFELEWGTLSLIVGACTLVSLGLLFLAVRIHEKAQ